MLDAADEPRHDEVGAWSNEFAKGLCSLRLILALQLTEKCPSLRDKPRHDEVGDGSINFGAFYGAFLAGFANKEANIPTANIPIMTTRETRASM